MYNNQNSKNSEILNYNKNIAKKMFEKSSDKLENNLNSIAFNIDNDIKSLPPQMYAIAVSVLEFIDILQELGE